MQRKRLLFRAFLPALGIFGLVFGGGCKEPEGAAQDAPPRQFEPVAYPSFMRGRTRNREPTIASQCYADVRDGSNSCWTCHTIGTDPHTLVDVQLQSEYRFSDAGRQNAWGNLFADRRAEIAAIADDEILKYIRTDNLTALRESLRIQDDFPGFVPDIDFDKGFDEEGYAADGSGYRALRYKPFPGAFWPTNGSIGEVFVRLPKRFRSDAEGRPSRAVENVNWAILEAAMTAPPGTPTAQLVRNVGPIQEETAGVDLDGNGKVGGEITQIRGLPATYVGKAHPHPVRRYVLPLGIEFLHPVRYIDPDAPRLAARRIKELRYIRKVEELDGWALEAAYQAEANEKEEGHLPVFRGGPDVGLRNAFGFQIQAFIEDARGQLRLQTEDEHKACMGCHGAVGVAIDHTFSLARKVPGREGWRLQDLKGMADAPQVGHADPEVLTYFKRVQAGDDFHANQEMLGRFFPQGVLDEAKVRSAKDLADLLYPSRERALLLDKAYLALVRTQLFDLGRDPTIGPVPRARDHISEPRTGLAEKNKTYLDGRLHLSW